jgi:hypothetical protein
LIIDKYIISKFENKTSKKGRSLKWYIMGV